MDQLKAYLNVNPHWLSYAILDDITDRFGPQVNAIEMEVDAIDDLVLIMSQTEQSDMLVRIANARKRLTMLQRLLATKTDVMKVLVKRLENTSVGGMQSLVGSESAAAVLKDTALYLGDVQDHTIAMVQTLGHVDTILDRSHSNYLAQINIELTKFSFKSNASMNRLTAVAALAVPLNAITGLFGMNVRVPGQHDWDGSYTWFIGIAFVMISIIVGGYALAMRYNWFQLNPHRKLIKP
jgi:magnesium transporter